MPEQPIRVAELFAGVGGFRLGLEGCDAAGVPASGPFRTVWANQWEPPGTTRKQFAWRCYEAHFGPGSCVNEDIATVLDETVAGDRSIPDFDLLVGGFPCQDYSVARPLRQAGGIEGKKGVLWWDIVRMLELKRPRFALFENVDRLLKSPGSQRGRDFAIILSCLASLGYSVEWRVVNAADYGMPQRRRRVFIWCERDAEPWDLTGRTLEGGLLAEAFPAAPEPLATASFSVPLDPYQTSETFGRGLSTSPFWGAGAMQGGAVFTAKVTPVYEGPRAMLGDVLVPDAEVPERFFIDPAKLPAWETTRAAKRIPRVSRAGVPYVYSEGAMVWPDACDRPSRTILTSEGGAAANRTKHAVRGDSGRIRRLVPDELDQLQMFPRGWTNTGMSDGQRAFCMGNALVVGCVTRIGQAIGRRWDAGA